MTKKLKITFMPGAFDSFEGSQEELDQLIKDLEEGLSSGDLLEKSKPVDLDELELDDPELAESLRNMLNDDIVKKRKLN